MIIITIIIIDVIIIWKRLSLQSLLICRVVFKAVLPQQIQRLHSKWKYLCTNSKTPTTEIPNDDENTPKNYSVIKAQFYVAITIFTFVGQIVDSPDWRRTAAAAALVSGAGQFFPIWIMCTLLHCRTHCTHIVHVHCTHRTHWTHIAHNVFVAALYTARQPSQEHWSVNICFRL